MKIEQPGGHLDQMIRQTRASLMQLSSMADSKANMLLTAASVVITLCVPHLGSSAFRIPLVILVGGSLVTALMAAWCNYPRLPSAKHVSLEEARSEDFNILFFGDFSRMPYGQFEQAIGSAFNDQNRAYAIQLREIHALGCFLAKRKYRLVRWCYLSFMTSLICSACLALAQALGFLGQLNGT